MNPDARVDLSFGSAGRDAVLQSFLAGHFQNCALIQPDGRYKSIIGSRIVAVHPTSVMFGKKVEAIMYNEIVYTTKQYVRTVSTIQPSWLPIVAPNYYSNIQFTT